MISTREGIIQNHNIKLSLLIYAFIVSKEVSGYVQVVVFCFR